MDRWSLDLDRSSGCRGDPLVEIPIRCPIHNLAYYCRVRKCVSDAIVLCLSGSVMGLGVSDLGCRLHRCEPSALLVVSLVQLWQIISRRCE